MRLKDLTDQWLLKTHFFGIYETDDNGEVFLPAPQDRSRRLEKSVIQQAINESVAYIEDYLGATLRYQERITEYYDYDRDLYNAYMHISTRQYPVIQVHSLKLTYGEGGSTIWDVPTELIQINGSGSKFGLVRVLPMYGVASDFDPAYNILLQATLSSQFAPAVLELVYDAGMDAMTESYSSDKKHLPDSIVRAIGLKAAIHPFNILGDIVLGAGIASISESVSGVSTSINTTSSPENSAYSSRIIMHRKELMGEQGVPGLLQILAKDWRRPVIGLL